MSGIQFLIDAAGRKTAVVIDLNRHKAVWEDLYDTLLVKRRTNEPRELLAEVRCQLTKSSH